MAVSREEEVRLLSEVDVLESLSREEIGELASELPDAPLEEGEFLYTPRERGEELFLLKEGRVRVYEAGSGGDEFTFSVIGAGTIFGEMGLGPRRLRVAYARAMEPSIVARLDRARLEDLIRTKPDVGVDLVRLLSKRLRLFGERMADFASKDVTARLASLILYLVECEGMASGEGYEIPNRYTHEQLGTMIGARRVAVSRAFARLREAGAIEQRGRRIYVPDMEALERAAGAQR
jgi:CRP/FNR family cyclic AMP-dependent transcriptional regulator